MSERQLALSPQRLRASGARGPYMYRSASPPRRHRTWTSRENVSCPRTGRSSLRDVAVQRSFSCAPATEAAISPAIFLTSVSNIDPRHRQREGAALRARTGDAAGVVVPPRTGPPAPPPAPQAQNSVPVAAAPLTDANRAHVPLLLLLLLRVLRVLRVLHQTHALCVCYSLRLRLSFHRTRALFHAIYRLKTLCLWRPPRVRTPTLRACPPSPPSASSRASCASCASCSPAWSTSRSLCRLQAASLPSSTPPGSDF